MDNGHKKNKEENAHRFALSAIRGEREREQQIINLSEIDTTSSWSETSKLSLVVLDKERNEKKHGKNGPKLNRLQVT